MKSVDGKTLHAASGVGDGGVGPQLFAQPVALPTHVTPGCVAASHQLAGMQSDLLFPPPCGSDVCTHGEPCHLPARPSTCWMHAAQPSARWLGQDASCACWLCATTAALHSRSTVKRRATIAVCTTESARGGLRADARVPNLARCQPESWNVR